ncbi:cytochrome P450 [Aspergillus violaceofuscus CBS 115571]|uniref:Cytochrome P450 n=1 Tax=Aspergillus violaceofuscus (strain CBS 115571) TaxID=1450538 RepID=A0A2V5HSU6_ASPV1|nr:cytochrome P450 [Aspergillus violaceofuscus CBS 115571]
MSLPPSTERDTDSRIIRISHNHLHINDPDFYHEVFKPGTAFHRDPAFYTSLPFSNSVASLTDFHHHSLRRIKLNPAFTPSAVQSSLSTLIINIEDIGETLSRACRHGRPLNIQRLFVYLSLNMISDRIFGRSLRISHDQETLDDLATTLHFLHRHTLLFLNFPLLGKLVNLLPQWLLHWIVPGYVRMRKVRSAFMLLEKAKKGLLPAFHESEPLTPANSKYCASNLASIQEGREQANRDPNPDKRTLCDILLADGAESTSTGDFIDEAVLFMFAGADTTSYALANAVYHLLSSPRVLQTLQRELQNVDAQIRAHDWAATTVSTSHLSISRNATIFRNPRIYQPERWLSEGANGLDHWKVQFSKGPLAQMEMTMTLAYLFNRFDLVLYGTGAESMRVSD